MEVKPGYNQTEVGVIPQEWDVKRLGELFEVTSSKRVFQSDWKSQGVPFYRARELAVLGETGSVDNELFIARQLFETFKRSYGVPNTGDMLVTGVGTLGKVYVVTGEHEFYFKDGNIIWFKICGSVSSEFLRQLYLTPLITKQISNNSAGTTVGTYTIVGAKKTVIPLPPLPEQRAIAAALSDADALLGGLDRLIAKKRDLKQAAMQQLLTGQTRLPGFQGEREVKRLGEVGKCLRGVSYKGDSDLSTHDTPHTKRLLRSNNIQNAVVVTDEVQFVNAARVSSHQILQEDDILICMANGSKALVGKAGIFTLSDGQEYTFGAFMGCFRTNSTQANPAFAFYLFLTARYRDYINNLLAGSSINNLRPSSIESLEFSTPPLPEQTAIAAVLSDMDAELAALQARRDKTRDLKQAMMQELLTGRTRLV